MRVEASEFVAPAVERAEWVAKRDSAEAARDFEALLIGQLMKAAREATEALFPDDDAEAGSETYFEMAEEALGKMMAQQDLLGVTRWLQSEEQTTTLAAPELGRQADR